MRLTGKHILIGGGGLLIGGILLMSGDASADGGGGPMKWDQPIEPPMSEEEVMGAKTALCLCWRGMDPEEFNSNMDRAAAAVRCALKQVYTEVPWSKVLDPIHPESHKSLVEVAAVFSGWAAELAQLPGELEREEWCKEVGELPEPPPEPEPDPPVVMPNPVDSTAKRQERMDELLAPPGQPVPGSFYLTYYKDPVGVKGQSGFARALLDNVGVDNPDPQMVVALMKAISASQWNRGPYARNAEPGEYHQVAGKVVDPMFRPAHEDAVAAFVEEGRRPIRTINDAGKRVIDGHTSYGLAWAPNFDVEKAKQGMLIITGQEPPADFLEMLG